MVSKKKKDNIEVVEAEAEEENFESTLQQFEEMLKEKKRMSEQQQQHQEEEKIVKPKRPISDLQREKLAIARQMAQLKKKEMKEITEKKNIIKHLKKEEDKLNVEDEYNKTLERVTIKKQPKPIEQPIIEKQRKIKKIIYEDDEEEEKPRPKEFSFVEATKKSAMQQMQDKINEDRMKFLYQKYILR